MLRLLGMILLILMLINGTFAYLHGEELHWEALFSLDHLPYKAVWVLKFLRGLVSEKSDPPPLKREVCV